MSSDKNPRYLRLTEYEKLYHEEKFEMNDDQIPEDKMKKRIVIVSDTHMMHDQLVVPDGDIFIHCGDFTNYGTVFEAIQVNKWLGTLKHKFKILVPGNHENFPDVISPFLTNCDYFLLDHEIEVDGIKIWGSRFKSSIWFNAFMNDGWSKTKWSDLPSNLDILITHQPPRGIFDSPEEDEDGRGNDGLLEVIKASKPKIHLFGHVHEHGGSHKKVHDTSFVNCALCLSKKKKLIQQPIVIDILVDRKK